MLAAADVECPVDHDVELEAGAGSELEQADAALDSVAERDQADARSLLEPADAPRRGRHATVADRGAQASRLAGPSI